MGSVSSRIWIRGTQTQSDGPGSLPWRWLGWPRNNGDSRILVAQIAFLITAVPHSPSEKGSRALRTKGPPI